jgi:hypothetical protein
MTQTDDVADVGQQRLPERQRERRPRILPAPQRVVARVGGDHAAGVRAEVVERCGVLPAVGQDRRPVPVGAEAVQQILADRLQRAVLPVAVRIPGGIVAQIGGRAEVDTDRREQ